MRSKRPGPRRWYESLNQLENRLWEAADELRVNSGLSAQEYSRPVLGLIFLRYAEARFVQAKEEIDAEQPGGSSRRRRSSSRKAEFQERGVMFVPEEALYSDLLELSEGEDVSEAVVCATTLPNASSLCIASRIGHSLVGPVPPAHVSTSDASARRMRRRSAIFSSTSATFSSARALTS